MAGVGATLLRGCIAGLAGTAAMTVAQQIEMSRTGRSPSLVPGRVAARLLRRSPSEIERPMHWAHGVTLGAVRGLITHAGLRGLPGSAAFFAVLWSGDVVLYKSLGIADWPWRWTVSELATDTGHKALYAVLTGTASDALNR